MINLNERKIKRADRGKTRERPKKTFLSANGVDLIERFHLQCKKIYEWEEQGPTPGTIWNSQPEREEDLFGPILLILKALDSYSGPNFLVVEVSEYIGQAMETDLVIGSDESSLSFNCVIRPRNMFWTSSNWLKDCIGEIDASICHEVLKFAFFNNFDENISPRDYQFVEIDGTILMRRCGATSGLPVTGNGDPRLNFLKESKRKCQYLSDGMTVGTIQSKIDHKQVYDKVWIGNKSFLLEPLETQPGVSRIKGCLALQDITTSICKERVKGGSRFFRLEAEDAPPINFPLAAFEDLRDGHAKGLDLRMQRQLHLRSSPKFQGMCEEQLNEGIGLRLEAVLSCIAKDIEVKILCDDSATAMFLQVTPVKEKIEPWMIRHLVGMASSIIMLVPPKSKSFTQATTILLKHLSRENGSLKDIEFFRSLPPDVLKLLTKASQRQEAGEALNRISALAEKALHAILKRGESKPSFVERARIWARELLVSDSTPERLLRIGRELFGGGKAWKEIELREKSLQEISSSLEVLRNSVANTQERCESIARLAGILGSAPGWEQVENILYRNQFCWPRLMVRRQRESNKSIAMPMPIAVDISFDNRQNTILLREKLDLATTLELNLQKYVQTAKTFWKGMPKDAGSVGELIENASATFDFRITERMAAEVAMIFDTKISLSIRSANEDRDPFLERLFRVIAWKTTSALKMVGKCEGQASCKASKPTS